MFKIYKILCLIIVYLNSSEQCINKPYRREVTVSNNDLMDKYCSAFNSCTECKEASPECDWCHDVGCTHFPNYHCPQKLYLDKTYKKHTIQRVCNEIVSNGPMFIPAQRRKFITMNLRIDDLTLYKRDLICEIHVEDTVLRVKGSISESMLYCDMTILRTTRSVAMGYIRLYWGGAEPLSNMVLIIVYMCEYMASNCVDCQVLNKGFNCGWCEDINKCSLEEECPKEYGSWIKKKSQCGTRAAKLPVSIPNEILLNNKP